MLGLVLVTIIWAQPTELPEHLQVTNEGMLSRLKASGYISESQPVESVGAL